MDPRTHSDAPSVTVEVFAMIQSRLSRRDPSLTFLGTTQTAGEALAELSAGRVVVPGIDADSMWASTDPEVVEMADQAFDAVWSVSPPAVPAGDEPPLTPRMVSIAFLLADGASDRLISRELGISERTVSAEVREIGRRLGTVNRSHTIARICGAPA